MVDGVTAAAYGTPESAAAILAASEGTAGVRDDGGLGGGGAGAASFAVGEQLQNMVLRSLGVLGVWGQRRRGCPAMGPGTRRGARRELFQDVRPRWVSSGARAASREAESRGAFEVPSVLHAASCERSAAARNRPRAAQSSSACCRRYVRKPPCRNQESYGAQPPVRANSSAAPSRQLSTPSPRKHRPLTR